jgi:hypothetical protein
MKSKFLNWNWKDAAKAAGIAGLAIIVGSLATSLNQVPPHLPSWPEFLQVLILAAKAAGLYLLKNLITNSNDQLLKKEPPPVTLTSNVQNLNN